MNTKKRIAVIGAGALGLSVARCLAEKGAEVSIFERNVIGAGTSTTTFAWINSNGKNPKSYHQLNVAAMEEHISLQEQARSEGQWLIRSGTYEWVTGISRQERLAKRINTLRQSQYAVDELSREQLKTRVPEIRIDPQVSHVWHFPNECLLYPTIFLAHQWSEARRLGATLHCHSDIVDVKESNEGVTLSLADGNVWCGEQIVLATGRWSKEIMARMGMELALIDPNQPNKIACGFLAQTNPLVTQLSANLITPELNVRPDGGGRLLLQAPDLDHFANPAVLPSADGFIGREMLNRLHRLIDNTESAIIDRIAVGQRARPADGLPGVGFVTPLRKVYLMVTHSGMTLAPLLGRLSSDEIIFGQRSQLLNDFSPERLIGKSAEDFPAFSTLHFPAAQ